MTSLGLAGCSGTPHEETTDESAYASTLVDTAKDGGADASQIAILEKGSIDFADYEAAVNRTLSCMREAGVDVIVPEVTNTNGLPMLWYGYSPDVPGLTQEQGKALGDECMTRFSYWVEQAWQMQPSSLEAKEQFFLPYRSAIVACIRENGGTVADDATREETAIASSNIQQATGIDCFMQSGLSLS